MDKLSALLNILFVGLCFEISPPFLTCVSAVDCDDPTHTTLCYEHRPADWPSAAWESTLQDAKSEVCMPPLPAVPGVHKCAPAAGNEMTCSIWRELCLGQPSTAGAVPKCSVVGPELSPNAEFYNCSMSAGTWFGLQLICSSYRIKKNTFVFMIYVAHLH